MKNIIKKVLSVAFVFSFFLAGQALAAGAPIIPPAPYASNITQTSAVLNGIVNPNGATTNAWFLMQQNPNQQLGSQNIGSGTSNVTLTPYTVTGLTPGTTYQFAISATNSYGYTSSAYIQFTTLVNNNPPPTIPSATLTANPTTVTAGGSSNISWTVSNATSCTASGGTAGWAGPKSINGGTFTASPINANTQFTLTCINNYGSVTKNVWVYVTTPPPPAPVPTVNLNANPTTIVAGGSTTLSWNSTNATSCSANASPSNSGWTGPKNLNGSQTVSNINVSTTFTLVCQNASGNTSDAVLVYTTTPPPPPPPPSAPTVNLVANPTFVSYGGATNLSWYVTNATSCTANSNPSTTWTGSKNANGGSQTISNLTSTTYFNITCSGAGGSASDTVYVTVGNQPPPPPPPPSLPTVNLTASPTSIAYNGSSTLSWNSTNATSCNATGGVNGWAGAKNLNGYFPTGTLTNTTTYTITCNGAGGSATDSVTVLVGSQPQNPPVITSFYASPNSVAYNGTTTLYWNVTGATTCTAGGYWSGNKNPVSGSQSVGSLVTNPTTFTLTCTGAGGSDTATTSVTVGSAPQNAPTVNLTASPTSVAYNGSTTLSWTVTNATFCIASGGWNGNTSATTGSFTVVNLTATTTFTLTCTNATGSASDSVTVFVNAQPVTPPSVNLTANDTNIAYNSATTINWYVTGNATSCTGTSGANGWAGAKSVTNSNFYTGVLTSTTTYTITCSNAGGSDTDSVTVVVSGQPNTNLPLVTTNAVNNVGINYATLNGFVNANGGSNVSAWFEYGTNGNYGNITPSNNYGNTSGTGYNHVLGGLQSNTSYYYRAVAQNASGQVVYGNQMAFTTIGTPIYNPPYIPPYNPCGIFNSSCAPTAITTLATNIGQTSARLNGLGLVNNNVLTTGYFEWGTTQFLGNTTVSQTIGSNASNPFFYSTFGLSPNTTYFYRAVVTNQYGTSQGDIVTFRTNPVNTVINTGTNTNVITRTNVIYRDVVVNTNTTQNLVAGVSKPSLVFLGVNCNNQVLVPGEIFECVVNWKNVSSKNLTDVLLRVGFPKELTFLQASRGYFSEVDNAVVVEIINLAPGEEGSMVFTTRVRTDAQLGKVVVVAGSLVYSYTGDNGAFAQEEVFAYSSHTIQGGLQLQGATVLGASYLPSSLLGWLLLLLIILLIILLARMAYNSTRPHTVIIPEHKNIV